MRRGYVSRLEYEHRERRIIAHLTGYCQRQTPFPKLADILPDEGGNEAAPATQDRADIRAALAAWGAALGQPLKPVGAVAENKDG